MLTSHPATTTDRALQFHPPGDHGKRGFNSQNLEGRTFTVNVTGGGISMSMRMLFVAALMLASCGSGCAGPAGPSGPGPVSYDGNWSVLVQIDSCYSFSNTSTVTVSGGAFSGTPFTYCV